MAILAGTGETSGTDAPVSPIDGIDRIFSYRHLPNFRSPLMVGIGHDAIFADWEMMRLTVIVTRLCRAR